MAAFIKSLLSRNNFEDVIAIFCCYGKGSNASEADEKITKDANKLNGIANHMAAWLFNKKCFNIF